MDVGSFSHGQATAWMPELRQRRSGCPSPFEKPGQGSRACRAWRGHGCPSGGNAGAIARCPASAIGVSFSLGHFSFTPGILPSALRASFAVHTRSCAYVDKQKRSASAAAGRRKPLTLKRLISAKQNNRQRLAHRVRSYNVRAIRVAIITTPYHPPSSNQSSASAAPRRPAHSAHPSRTRPHLHPAPDHCQSSIRD
jgi:hypothetical protein